MKRAVIIAIFGAWLSGCALWHDPDADASLTTDGGAITSDGGTSTLDGASSVDGGTSLGGSEGRTCGPNRCRTAEVCCDDRCGICAFEGECPSFECPDPASSDGSRP